MRAIMANETVTYDNRMNKLSFVGFEDKDFDLLMCICSRMKNLGEAEQTFDYDYLMELVGWDKTQNISVFHEKLKGMCDKLRKVGATFDISEDEFISFNLFDVFTGNKQKRTLRVGVNKKYMYILNNLVGNFTSFELKEYVRLSGRYPKQLYAQLRQRYKMQGHFWQVDIDELRAVLSIPESYHAKEITAKVIEPAVEVIRSCKGFGELEVEVLRSRRRGRPVTGYRFTWTEDKQVPGQMDITDVMKAQKKRPKKTGFRNFEEPDYDMDAIAKIVADRGLD